MYPALLEQAQAKILVIQFTDIQGQGLRGANGLGIMIMIKITQTFAYCHYSIYYAKI